MNVIDNSEFEYVYHVEVGVICNKEFQIKWACNKNF